MTRPRVVPIDPPYSPDTQKLFDIVMPAGVDPLVLFRTLATNRRVFSRFMNAGILDPGPVEVRDRELVILRTTARCNSEYEWGVHVTAFGRPLGFSDELVRATVEADAADPVWSPRQALLVRFCDALHDTHQVPDELWTAMREHWSDDQLIELLYTVGCYRSVSVIANGLKLDPEPFAERFPGRDGGG